MKSKNVLRNFTLTIVCLFSFSLFATIVEVPLTLSDCGDPHYDYNTGSDIRVGNPNFMLNDPFTYNPLDPNSTPPETVFSNTNQYHARAEMKVETSTLEASFPDADDSTYVSFSFTVPEGGQLKYLHFWCRDNDDQLDSYDSIRVILEKTDGTREISSSIDIPSTSFPFYEFVLSSYFSADLLENATRLIISRDDRAGSTPLMVAEVRLAANNGDFAGPLRPLALSNVRSGMINYSNTVISSKGSHLRAGDLSFIIDDPITFDPNELSNIDEVESTFDSELLALKDGGSADRTTDTTYVLASLGKTDSSDYKWVSVDFEIPRGKILSKSYHWTHNNASQWNWTYKMGIMLEDTRTGLRHSSTEDYGSGNQTFNFADADARSTDTDGIQRFEVVSYSNVLADMDYSSNNVSLYMKDDLLYKANRFFLFYAGDLTNKPLYINEIRVAIDNASAWEIDSLSSAIVATDSTVTKDGDFDLAALQAMYAAQVQFKDVWGYDTTGVVTWNDGGFDIATANTYTITGTLALPNGTVDTNSSLGELSNITFQVTVNTGEATFISEQQKRVKLYPNPARDVLRIEGLENEVTVRIYNLRGQQMIQTEIRAEANKININTLPQGIYILSIKNDTYKFQVR